MDYTLSSGVPPRTHVPCAGRAERVQDRTDEDSAMRAWLLRRQRLHTLLPLVQIIKTSTSKVSPQNIAERPGSLNGLGRRENRWRGRAHAPGATPPPWRAPGTLGAATPPGGRSGRSCDEVARWSPQRARSPGETDRRTPVRPAGADDRRA